MFQGEKDEADNYDPRLTTRANIERMVDSGMSNKAIIQATGATKQWVSKIRQEMGKSLVIGQRKIVEEARKAGYENTDEYLRDLAKKGRPHATARTVGVSGTTLGNMMKKKGIQSTAPFQQSEELRQRRAAHAKSMNEKIPDDHLPNIASKLNRGYGTQTVYARQYDATPSAMSRRLRTVPGYRGGERGKPRRGRGRL